MGASGTKEQSPVIAELNASRSDTGGVKSRERVLLHGEVFTPPHIVDAMLNLLPSRGMKNVWAVPENGEQKRFLEPACGEGAFLVEVLNRKLSRVNRRFAKRQEDWEWHSAICVSSIYGIELLEDNAERCITNLYEVYLDHYYRRFASNKNPAALSAIKFLIGRNIMQGDALSFCRADGSPIIVSEFTPIVREDGERMLLRKDFDFQMLSEREQNLFTLLQDEPGKVAEYEPVPWLDIERASKEEGGVEQ